MLLEWPSVIGSHFHALYANEPCLSQTLTKTEDAHRYHQHMAETAGRVFSWRDYFGTNIFPRAWRSASEDLLAHLALAGQLYPKKCNKCGQMGPRQPPNEVCRFRSLCVLIHLGCINTCTESLPLASGQSRVLFTDAEESQQKGLSNLVSPLVTDERAVWSAMSVRLGDKS